MAHDRPSAPHRRHFLKHAGLGAVLGAAAVPGQFLASADEKKPDGDAMPMRQFGRHDVKVSALGMGGHHLGDYKTVDEAIKAVHEAIDGGITFFDNCWEYWNGLAEDRLGRALKGKRDKVFLMTKVCTHGRSAKLAMQMLEESLRRLNTDHLDLWQVHGMSFDNDPELAYAKGGVIEALDEAKKAGKVRFVGFTGHKTPDVHLEMITRGYAWDSVQMPLNAFDANFLSFEKKVLPEANKRKIAVLGMKPMGGTAWAIKKGVVKAEEMLRYAMSLPVTVTISGMDSLEVLRNNLKVAHGFTPLAEKDMDALRQRCAPDAGDGRFEPYKLSLKFDNPQAREPHGFPLDPTQKEVQEMFKEAGAGPK
jgi:aryl-alcohol dehydrogenase-like predicted oxidoreductase